jgi:hypothetical protein
MVWDKKIWSGVELVSTITVSPSGHGLGQEYMKWCWTSKYHHSLPLSSYLLVPTMTRGEDCDGTHYFKTTSYLLVPIHEKRGRLWWYLLVLSRFISSCPKPVQEGETVMVLTSSTPLHIFLSQTMTRGGDCDAGLGQEYMKWCWTSKYHHSLPLLSWFGTRRYEAVLN